MSTAPQTTNADAGPPAVARPGADAVWLHACSGGRPAVGGSRQPLLQALRARSAAGRGVRR